MRAGGRTCGTASVQGQHLHCRTTAVPAACTGQPTPHGSRPAAQKIDAHQQQGGLHSVRPIAIYRQSAGTPEWPCHGHCPSRLIHTQCLPCGLHPTRAPAPAPAPAHTLQPACTQLGRRRRRLRPAPPLGPRRQQLHGALAVAARTRAGACRQPPGAHSGRVGAAAVHCRLAHAAATRAEAGSGCAPGGGLRGHHVGCAGAKVRVQGRRRQRARRQGTAVAGWGGAKSQGLVAQRVCCATHWQWHTPC